MEEAREAFAGRARVNVPPSGTQGWREWIGGYALRRIGGTWGRQKIKTGEKRVDTADWICAAALAAAALLGGMETVYGAWALKGRTERFDKVWKERLFYGASLIWLIVLGGLWLGGRAMMEGAGGLLGARLAFLFITYLFLAAVDIRRRIVPDRMLLCYFLAQLLLGSAGGDILGQMGLLARGAVFLGAALAFAWLSKGRLGMGDAKLLGVTAMTAGWGYTLQTVVYGLLLSFVYSLWLLLFRRLDGRTEIPFVPFLAAAVGLQMLL